MKSRLQRRSLGNVRVLGGITLALVIPLWLGAGQGHAASIFDTASGALVPAGLGLTDVSWPTHRFEVTSPVTVKTVGGFFSGGGPVEIFAAITALSGPSDFPDSLDLSTPDVLATTLFTVGSDPPRSL